MKRLICLALTALMLSGLVLAENNIYAAQNDIYIEHTKTAISEIQSVTNQLNAFTDQMIKTGSVTLTQKAEYDNKIMVFKDKLRDDEYIVYSKMRTSGAAEQPYYYTNYKWEKIDIESWDDSLILGNEWDDYAKAVKRYQNNVLLYAYNYKSLPAYLANYAKKTNGTYTLDNMPIEVTSTSYISVDLKDAEYTISKGDSGSYDRPYIKIKSPIGNTYFFLYDEREDTFLVPTNKGMELHCEYDGEKTFLLNTENRASLAENEAIMLSDEFWNVKVPMGRLSFTYKNILFNDTVSGTQYITLPNPNNAAVTNQGTLSDDNMRKAGITDYAVITVGTNSYYWNRKTQPDRNIDFDIANSQMTIEYDGYNVYIYVDYEQESKEKQSLVPVKGLDNVYILDRKDGAKLRLTDKDGKDITNYVFEEIDNGINEAGLLKVRIGTSAGSTVGYLNKDLKIITLTDRYYSKGEVLKINGKYYLKLHNDVPNEDDYYDTNGNKLDKLPINQINETTTETTTSTVTAVNNNPKDSPSYWAQNEVSEAISYGILPVKFQSDYTKPITRENFCELIIDTLRVQNADILKSADAEGMNFTDTNNSDIKLASALGIVAGVGNNKFAPYGKITRQEAARMLYQAAAISERFPETEKYFDPGFIYNNKKINSPYQFDDISKFEYWSSLGIQYCYQNDIMFGVGQNNFDPTGSYTREQAYLTALRLYKKYNGDGRFFDAEYNYNTHKFIYCDKEFDKVYTICENKIIVFNNGKYSLVDYSGNYFIDDISKNIELLNRSDISVYDCSGDWLIITEPLNSRSDGSIYDYRSSLYKADGTYLWTMPNLHFTNSGGNVIYVNESDESDGDNIKKARYTLFEREKYEQDGYMTKTTLVYKK